VRHFCTYFDVNYLTRGLALYQSLTQVSDQPFTLWILCFDEASYRTLAALRLPAARLIRRSEFEAGDDALAVARGNRSSIEYYWTCTPSLPLYVFRQDASIEEVTYLDADLLFFSSPEPLYSEHRDWSILLVEHRYAPQHAVLQPLAGVYNVELLAFKRDENGLAALQWWRARCLEWCYQYVEDGKYGDQRYLDDWATRFAGVCVVTHDGAGVAPWNAARYWISEREGRLYVGNSPLVFFHFHAFVFIGDWICVTDKNGYRVPRQYVRAVYGPYLHALQAALAEVRAVDAGFDAGFTTLSMRDFLRFVEQRKVLMRPGGRLSRHVWVQFGRVRWPSLAEVKSELPGLLGRFLSRRTAKALGR